MTTLAIAIRTEIRELIDLQIQVFGQPTQLTPFELADYRRRAERIKSLGRELDQLGITDSARGAAEAVISNGNGLLRFMLYVRARGAGKAAIGSFMVQLWSIICFLRL